jgi:hypothetical protein
MLPDKPYQIKILRPTPHWVKQIIQSLSTIVYYVLVFLKGTADFRKGVME